MGLCVQPIRIEKFGSSNVASTLSLSPKISFFPYHIQEVTVRSETDDNLLPATWRHIKTVSVCMSYEPVTPVTLGRGKVHFKHSWLQMPSMRS